MASFYYIEENVQLDKIPIMDERLRVIDTWYH